MHKRRLQEKSHFQKWKKEIIGQSTVNVDDLNITPDQYPCLILWDISDNDHGEFVIYEFVYSGEI